ncbi:xylan 1,4-beta-xylosidase [Streptosporangiaceae bacterium NEAU-GS5]|nr:xylan 1,4-beta-xylosidase [Streptosporangiaceae bacterium NEAU-GS5]
MSNETPPSENAGEPGREARGHYRHARRSGLRRLLSVIAVVAAVGCGTVAAVAISRSAAPSKAPSNALAPQDTAAESSTETEVDAASTDATEEAATAAVGGMGKDWPVWGFTHTRFSADSGDDGPTGRAKAALSRRPVLQNQHIMGFGADNPEPSPGQYDWASLDQRMDLVRKTKGVPVITLCCAPDWMVGGVAGQTQEEFFTQAPRKKYFKDFAALAAKVAKRYPFVKHYIVWNEFKGFFDEKLKRWDYEGYTEMYNLVYDALKKVNPNIKVGGPYVNVTDRPGWPSELKGPWGSEDQRGLNAIKYWLRNKHGADFIVVDGTSESSKGMYPDEFRALDKFGAVNAWLRKQTKLPIWWAEWYFSPAKENWSVAHRTAVQAAAMIEFGSSGTAAALYWSPQNTGSDCPGCLWTNTDQSSGGRPLPALGVIQDFARWFPYGTKLVKVGASNDVRVLAQAKMMVVVNTTGHRVTTTVDGKKLTLSAYQIKWVGR